MPTNHNYIICLLNNYQLGVIGALQLRGQHYREHTHSHQTPIITEHTGVQKSTAQLTLIAHTLIQLRSQKIIKIQYIQKRPSLNSSPL